jgi:hypothetical protein
MSATQMSSKFMTDLFTDRSAVNKPVSSRALKIFRSVLAVSIPSSDIYIERQQQFLP